MYINVLLTYTTVEQLFHLVDDTSYFGFIDADKPQFIVSFKHNSVYYVIPCVLTNLCFIYVYSCFVLFVGRSKGQSILWSIKDVVWIRKYGYYEVNLSLFLFHSTFNKVTVAFLHTSITLDSSYTNVHISSTTMIIYVCLYACQVQLIVLYMYFWQKFQQIRLYSL